MEQVLEQELTDALKTLRDNLPGIFDTLDISADKELRSWKGVIEGKLLPRLSPDFPLMAAVCGGGSSGKSTLFNSLVGDRLSPSGGKAGINRRILVSAPGKIFRKKEFLSTLFEPFGTASKPLENKEELTVPGCPLYILSSNVPRNMVLMDTPDFDTGARGDYTNREVVRQALETADVLIYIFTNSNYNNRDNTDFISDMLTGLGMRKCFLVYRVYAGFENQEVVEHAMTVARNLYGDEAEKYVLGIYRTDEDNRVAAGEQFMKLRPARKQDPDFGKALKNMDPRKLRPELIASILEGSLKKAEEMIIRAKLSHDELRLYLDTLRTVQSQCVQDALPHFPIDVVLKRFIDLWLESDPPYIRAMRKTGNIMGHPVRLLSDAAEMARSRIFGSRPKKGNPDDFKGKVEANLLRVVTDMYRRSVGSELSASLTAKDPIAEKLVEIIDEIFSAKGGVPYIEFSDQKGAFTVWVPTHPVVFKEQEALRERDWEKSLEIILAHKNVIVEVSENIEKDLRELVERLREQMRFSDKLRHTFSAMLNVLPATAAITYIISTGDAVGGAGIKVQLAGLFGLNDLYALIAIPATRGLRKTDQQQMEDMLGPLAQVWLNDKLRAVQELFETEITGGIIRTAKDAIHKSDKQIRLIENSIKLCRKVAE